jgi:cell division protein FtsA
MKNSDIAVGLDIGTTKIVAIVGRRNDRGKVEVLGVGKTKSLGVHRGVVNNITKTMESIQTAISEAEAASGENIKSVVVGIAGQHIRSLQHTDYIDRDNFDEVIEEEDIDELVNQVKKLVMLPGEEIIHVLPQEFKIDGQSEIKEPVGMSGRRLESNFHVVVGNVASIRNIGRCVVNSGLELDDITLEPIASANSVLSEEEKEAGVALIDIGGGTTDLAIFKDGIIRHSAVVPFGGNVITEDIKEGCSIIEKQAELLKVKFGSAWPGENSENEIVSIPGLRGREPKEVTMKNLSKIIHARVIEIIEHVFLEIKNYGHEETKKKLIAGIVLTGGGAELKHIRQMVEYITGMDCRIGYPNEHLASGSDKRLASPIFATSVGLLIRGLEKVEARKKLQIEPEEVEVKEPEVVVMPTNEEAPKEEEVVDEKPVVEEIKKPKKEKSNFFESFVTRLREFLEDE